MNKVRSVAVSIIIIVAVSTLTLATLQLRRPTLSSDPQQASMFSDNFTRDTGLNTNLWQENGLVGRAVTSLWHAQDGGYSVTTIVPSLIFSSTDGMGVSGVTGVFQISTIDSISSFSPPFTLQATVTATEANGNPFALWIASSNGVQGLGVTGNLNPNNGNYYGMWKAYPRNGGWNALGTVLYRSPSINTLYQVTINVAADGTGSVEVSSNGATLGSSSQQVGRGPFYILLAQMEGLPYTVGPNQAYWTSVSLSASREPKRALSEPFGIAFDPTNNNVYVANYESNTVSVIDSRSNRITHAIPVGTNPNQVAYDPANQEIYVSNSGSTTVSAISSTNNKVVATITTDPVTPLTGEYGPFWLTFNPTNNEMYVTNYNFPSTSDTVVAINSTTNTVAATISVGQNPIRLAYNPSNGCIYVADYSSGQISVISPSNRVVATISVPGNPDFLGYDPENSEIYVASNNSNQVTAINSTTNTLVATINIGGNPYGATYDPANGEMFVSATTSDAVYAINSATNTVAATIPANNPRSPGPYSLTYDPANRYLYVSNTNDNNFSPSTVSVISATNTIIANVPTGAKPDQSIYDPANNNMYVVNQNSDSVTVIDSGNSIVATIGTSTPPQNSGTPPSVFLLQPFSYDNCVSINGAMNPTTPGATLGPASWSWGDGSKTTSWFPATHTYAATGTYLVRVTATDSNGLKGTTSTTVNLTGSTVLVPPQLTIFSPAIDGETVTVNGVANSNACEPEPLQPFSFNWGDGTVSTGWFPQSHTYNSPANFEVCVTATDSFGATTTKCELATVQ